MLRHNSCVYFLPVCKVFEAATVHGFGRYVTVKRFFNFPLKMLINSKTTNGQDNGVFVPESSTVVQR